jgi:hypothetical protein
LTGTGELVSQTENNSSRARASGDGIGPQDDWSFCQDSISGSELAESQRFGSDLSFPKDGFQILTVRIISDLITKQYDKRHIILQIEVLFDERKFMLLVIAVTTFHFSRLAGVLG